MYTPQKRYYSQSIAEKVNNLLKDELVKTDKWAQKFLPSILNQYRQRGNISAKQYSILVEIEEKYQNEDSRKEIIKNNAIRKENVENEKTAWEKEYFGTQIEEDARVIAEYYKQKAEKDYTGTFYYEQIVLSILSGKLPKRDSCLRMIDNKYSKKILNEWRKEPKYKIKSMVARRSKNVKSHSQAALPSDSPDFFFVLKVNVEPPTPVAGGKKYLICPNNKMEAIIVEERALKKYKGK